MRSEALKNSALAILTLVLLALPQAVMAAGWQEIAPGRVYEMLKEGSGLWLIDVRAPASFERGHIEGAVNIPASELTVKRFPKQKILIVADHSLGDLQAKEAAEALVKSGHERAFVLAGGLHGWRQAGLPAAGEGASGLAKVMPRELEAAREAKVPLRLLDLRQEAERSQGPVPGAESVQGKDLAEKLLQVRRILKQEEKEQKKNLAQKLRAGKTTVLLLPVAADAEALVQRHLWGLDADVRYVEGGYLAAAPRQKLTVSNVEGCATCPGGKGEGTLR